MFVGTPMDRRVPNLEKPLGRARPPFLAPSGTSNVALHKPVKSSCAKPMIGSLHMITDGDKEGGDSHYVELDPFVQFITIDLEQEYELYAIVIWHYHKQPRVYFDVVAQVYTSESITDVKTVFNNDIDNSAGLGIGKDMHYTETYEGKLIDCLSQDSQKAQYVRLYSNGNTSNDLNHYIEVEVYGKPVAIYDPPRGDYGAETIHGLVAENKLLKQALTNIRHEDQIGYAKVINQKRTNGSIRTTIKFVETARDNKLKKILEKEYTIEGDIIHFDTLIVNFGNKMVIDSKPRALYLLRRVYGDKMVKEEGFVIEQSSTEPRRYIDLLEDLPAKESQEFWSKIWDLANDTEKFKEYDIEAVNVDVVCSRLRKGLIYVLKINQSGQVYLENIPDI
jgi:hypothetical protein